MDMSGIPGKMDMSGIPGKMDMSGIPGKMDMSGLPGKMDMSVAYLKQWENMPSRWYCILSLLICGPYLRTYFLGRLGPRARDEVMKIDLVCITRLL